MAPVRRHLVAELLRVQEVSFLLPDDQRALDDLTVDPGGSAPDVP
jgi:hypothetical protein